MTRTGSLFVAVLLVACGGSTHHAARPAPAPTSQTELPATEAAAYQVPPPVAPVEPTPEPVVPEPAPPPAPVRASVELTAVKGGAPMATLTFERRADGFIEIAGEFHGLAKGSKHALYIHEHGDCSGKGKLVGGHLDPTHAKHGVPSSNQRHAGDFGNITADESGNATFAMATDSITMEAERPDSVLDRAMVLHAGKDDARGSGGAALACGVIHLVTPQE